ncbi:MAG TPA: hypothetical protein VM513_31025 [Kofleriaceae bacterium]|nr:hypothetical protein [Kofleriaceae bacterium]
MRSIQGLVIGAVFLVGCLPKMRDTGKPANPDTFDAIKANAESSGYAAERSAEGARDGKYFWYTKASKDGGTIYFTKNNSTGAVAFSCSGGPFDKADACDAAGLALINGQ